MKLTKKLKAEILKAYNAYWDSFFNGDMRAFASRLDASAQIIGTSANEVFGNKASAVKFYKATAGQVTGKAALRNRKISMRAVENSVMITERSDFYALIDGEWTLYGYGRISTLMRKVGKAWKIIYEHGSLPDSKAAEGEQLNTERIKAENLQLREAVKRRTIELERKNRELEIEATLERVRARAMGMHNSADLSDTVNVFFLELKKLGVTPIRCGVAEGDEKTRSWTLAATSASRQGEAVEILGGVTKLDHPVLENIYKHWQLQKEYYPVLQVEDLKAYYHVLRPQLALPDFPDETKHYGNYFYFKEGFVFAMTERELSGEQVRIFRRFTSALSLTYRRYMDLKEAEAQARETQIEAALERVRARTMAMHKSEELGEVAVLLYKELRTLGLTRFFNCGYVEVDETNKIQYAWTTKPDGTLLEVHNLPLIGDPVFDPRYESWKRKEAIFSQEVGGDRLKRHIEFVSPHLGSEEAEEIARKFPDPTIFYCGNFSKGYLHIISGTPLTAEEESLLSRFTRVFEMTYSRFLDLKKAEAQVREAQIEAALERVRARTMAMHNSEELKEVVVVLYKQLGALGLADWGCSIMIFDKASNRIENWVAKSSGSELLNCYYVEGQKHPVFKKLWNYWEQQGPQMTLHHTDEVKRDFDNYWLNETDFKALPQKVKSSILNEREIFLSYASMRHGLLSAAGYKRLPDEKIAILERFSKVFEQTYTRFLDLQKAEAQTREAQIEAALERVRARTMAMHKSDELAETAVVLFEQLMALGLTPYRSYIGIIREKTGEIETWTTDEGGTKIGAQFVFEIKKTIALGKVCDGWKAQKKSVTIDLKGKDLVDHYRYLAEELHMPVTGGLKQDRRIQNLAYFSQGFIGMSSSEPLPQEIIDVLERFARVFDQTYRRFLDLQQAEAQAREAQIEAALERVRAKAMAMHNSDELANVVAAVFHELTQLDFVLARCIIWIPDPDTLDARWWMANSEDPEKPVSFYIQYHDHPPYEAYIAAWKKRKPKWVYDLHGETKVSWDDFLFGETELARLPAEVQAGMRAPDRVILSVSFSNFGAVQTAGLEFLSEENLEILRRFGQVFDMTYTRFHDLQKAEAQARQAVQQASLDRVRAEIASMRTADDLQRITPLIWRELTKLGVPFFRCGVFIINESTEHTHVYLSTPSGEAIAALHLKFDRTPVIAAAVQHWRQQQFYREEWNREQFIAWTQSLLEQRQIDSPQKYQAGEEAPEKLVLQFVPFTQGMLYIGSSSALSDDEIAIGQALAKAFGVAYARYEDFQRLEAAKAQVDAALDTLKKTQGQLVQAEKMASLGQLTAGIAHEIKNPLNFVNNFAALSVDLAKELREELIKRKTKNVNGDEFTDVEEILDMLEQNAEKINHHGKRADGIVRAMMQHARGGKGERQPTDVNKLVEEYVNLSYHGMRAKVPDFNVSIERDFGELEGKIEMVPQEIGRVLLNLLSNAFDAVHEKKQSGDGAYSPCVTVSTRAVGGAVEIRVRDNGGGIPDEVREKIFEPFFTTKPAGSGTGLGLSLSYDIVTQGHGGTLTVESKQGEGATFIITVSAR